MVSMRQFYAMRVSQINFFRVKSVRFNASILRDACKKAREIILEAIKGFNASILRDACKMPTVPTGTTLRCFNASILRDACK